MMQSQNLARAVSKIMAEKRDRERVKAAFSGIVSQDGEFVCHCIIRDVSSTGMKLEFPETKKMPDLFEIVTPAMPDPILVQSVWRAHKLMGVEMVAYEDEADEAAAGAA